MEDKIRWPGGAKCAVMLSFDMTEKHCLSKARREQTGITLGVFPMVDSVRTGAHGTYWMFWRERMCPQHFFIPEGLQTDILTLSKQLAKPVMKSAATDMTMNCFQNSRLTNRRTSF